jgi:hypothetical protein
MHPDIDVSEISEELPHLTPHSVINKGDVKVLKSGGERVATNSAWTSRFNDSLLDSEVVDFSKFLGACLSQLVEVPGIASFFENISQRGNVYLEVLIENSTSHYACLIEPDVLQLIGNLGLTLDIEYQHRDKGPTPQTIVDPVAD